LKVSKIPEFLIDNIFVVVGGQDNWPIEPSSSRAIHMNEVLNGTDHWVLHPAK
jgi:hypothetical protein